MLYNGSSELIHLITYSSYNLDQQHTFPILSPWKPLIYSLFTFWASTYSNIMQYLSLPDLFPLSLIKFHPCCHKWRNFLIFMMNIPLHTYYTFLMHTIFYVKYCLFTDDIIPDKCTLFLLLEVDHTLSHLLWKWNDEERKIGERGWGWEQVKEKHGKEDGNSNWRFLQLIHFHMNQNQKKQKIVIQALLFLIEKESKLSHTNM